MRILVAVGCSLCVTLVAVLTLMSGVDAKPKGCYFSSVPGNSTVYMDTHSGRTMPCGPGTVFSEKTCTCVHGENDLKWCRPRFVMDFNSKVLENKVIRYNIGGGNSFDLKKGFAQFNPSSSAIFWTFENRPFESNLQIQMRFRDDPRSKDKQQVLLTNCDAEDQPGAPSLLIFLDKTKSNPAKKNLIRVYARTYSKAEGVEVYVPYKSGEFNVLVVLKAMGRLNVRIDYEDGGRSIQSNKLKGNIILSKRSLRLGSCPKMNNGFTGEMDWFDYYPCWPRV